MTSDDAVNQLGLLAMTGKSQRIFLTPPRELLLLIACLSCDCTLCPSARAPSSRPHNDILERFRARAPRLGFLSATLYCLVHQQHDDSRQILSRAISPRQPTA
jgi:hypothetical protein